MALKTDSEEEWQSSGEAGFLGRNLFGRGEICEARAVGRYLGLCLLGVAEQHALRYESRCHPDEVSHRITAENPVSVTLRRVDRTSQKSYKNGDLCRKYFK
jgi:hypothetical protein